MEHVLRGQEVSRSARSSGLGCQVEQAVAGEESDDMAREHKVYRVTRSENW
jgi:hypothetical protein